VFNGHISIILLEKHQKTDVKNKNCDDKLTNIFTHVSIETEKHKRENKGVLNKNLFKTQKQQTKQNAQTNTEKASTLCAQGYPCRPRSFRCFFFGFCKLAPDPCS
jgi:hypothetical protein